jgi:hypothetical protein
MLNMRWKMLPWRNIAPTSRHQSPFETAAPCSAHWEKSEPPGRLMPPPCAAVTI